MDIQSDVYEVDEINIFRSKIYGIKGERLFEALRKSGMHEWAETALILQLVRVNTDVIDVGANIGYYSAMMSMFIGHAGKVHAFEANPLTAGLLSKTILENEWANVKLNRCAVAEVSGEIEVSSRIEVTKKDIENNFNLGGWSLLSSGSKKSIIEAITLDDYADRECLERVSLIKIDVEGYELNVLSGARKMIRRFKPNIMIELLAKDSASHERCMKCVELLNELDYGLKRIEKSPIPHLVDSEPEDFFEIPYHYNYIGLPLRRMY